MVEIGTVAELLHGTSVHGTQMVRKCGRTMKASGRLKSGASVTRANHLANAGYGFV